MEGEQQQQQPPEVQNPEEGNEWQQSTEQQNGAQPEQSETQTSVSQPDPEQQNGGEQLEHSCGYDPGYPSPMDAFRNGAHEKFLFVLCPNANRSKPDMLATVDVDPESSTYCKVVGRLDFPHAGDEVHNSGWNACSGCSNGGNAKRTHLIIPCLNTSRIYIVATDDPKNLKLHKIIEPEALSKADVSFPFTSHCLPDGTVMISTLGTANGSNKGDFFLLDGRTYEPKGRWAKGDKRPEYNCDFWYQPRSNLLISTEWGSPKKLKKGFTMKDSHSGYYGTHLNVWDLTDHKLLQQIKLEKPQGLAPFAIRFLHEPTSIHGYAVTLLGSSLYHIHKPEERNALVTEKVLTIEAKNVRKWLHPEMPAMLSNLVISMDDKYLYLSLWLHGEVHQYDISDPFHPKLVGKVNVGGMLHTESSVVFKKMSELKQRSAPTYVKGTRIEGGAQALQLSLDGKRLYVNTSLYTNWDFQAQPNIKNGTQMVMIDVNTENGGLKINENFLVDFGALPGGPFLGNGMRYPGGDCTSDIWA